MSLLDYRWFTDFIPPGSKKWRIRCTTKKPLKYFPNTIINLISDRKLSQQIHYIINQQLTGLFHLGSTDLITHHEFHKRLATKRGWNKMIFKQVYTTNDMRYIAVLPKENKLPDHLNTSCEEVLEDSFLNQGFL